MKARRVSKSSIETTSDRKNARAKVDRVKPDIALPAHWPRHTTPEYYTWMMRGMPQDAITANWSRHAPHHSHSPIFWYQDGLLLCRDCGADFVFTKNEQRAWYEEYKLPIHVKAVCCTNCRLRLRAELEPAKGWSFTDQETERATFPSSLASLLSGFSRPFPATGTRAPAQ